MKYIILILLFLYNTIYSQTLTGLVKDSKTNDNLEGVSILVKDTNIGTYSDSLGKFSLKLKEGLYNIRFSYIGYKDTIININLNKDKNILLKMDDISLLVDGIDINDIKTKNTEISVISDIKTLNIIANGISSQQITKTADRNIAEVMRRIPGITLQDNRFIIVRGLSERYNTVWLDNTITPSSEADYKSFSFDMIPSQIVSRIMIYKTPSADIPGDFSGAFVRITTLPIPEKNKSEFTYTVGYRLNTTFNKIKLAEGSKTDILGFDDGNRSLPGILPDYISDYGNVDYYTKVNKAFKNNWKVNESLAIPDQRFSFINQTKIKSNIGVTTALSYSLTNQIVNIIREDFNNDNTKNFHYLDNQNTQQATSTLLHNWSFILKKHKIEFKNFLNINGRNQTTIRTGQDFDGFYDVESGSLYYMDRILFTSQIGLNHRWSDKNNTDWSISYSRANRSEPDFKRYRRNRSLGSNEPYIMGIPLSSASNTNGGRFYSTIHENLVNFNINHEYNFLENIGIKTGLYGELKNRDFSARVFGYVQSSIINFNQDILKLPVHEVFDNISMIDGLKMDEITNPSDKYNSAYNNLSYYVLLKSSIHKFKVSTGLRIESNNQKLNGVNQNGVVVNNDIKQIFMLPSLNMNYRFNDSNILRLSFGKTINRPEFREISPFIFYNFELNSTIIGNTNLKIAEIWNSDLKWEYYFKNLDFVNFGIFYKKFINPIEWVVVPGTGGSLNRTFTFTNAKEANNYGLEIECRKSLDFVKLDKISIISNISFIKSEVNLGALDIQDSKRRMQGQSPYILNVGLFYQDSSFMVSVIYNVFGSRLFVVGDRTYPDVYEKERHVIDFNISKTFLKKWTIKLSIVDILNQPVILKQEISNNILSRSRLGSCFNLSLNVKI